jgi:AAA domain
MTEEKSDPGVVLNSEAEKKSQEDGQNTSTPPVKSPPKRVWDQPKRPTPDDVAELIKNGVEEGQRSEKFHYVVKSLKELGRSIDQIQKELAQFPEGIAKKYSKRLRAEIERSFDKPSSSISRTGKTSNIIHVASVRSRNYQWLWKGHLLKGAQELLTGIPGLGKSQLQISLVASATNPNKPWPDGTPSGPPCNVIMLTAEDTIEECVRPRLLAANADINRVWILDCIKEDDKHRQFLLHEDLDELEKLARKIGDVGLVTIDPITAYMGPKMDSHKSTEVRSQLGPLKVFAERTDIAVSTITHPPKASGAKAIDHFIGSQAFIAAGRVGHICVEEFVTTEDGDRRPTGRILYANPKNNAAPKSPTYAFRLKECFVENDYVSGGAVIAPFVDWEGPVDVTADEAVAGAMPVNKKEHKQQQLQKLISQFLKDGPVEQSTIQSQAEEMGFSHGQLRRAREKLGIVSERVGGVGPAGRWVWKRDEEEG